MVVKTVVEAQDIFDKAWEGFKGVDWKEKASVSRFVQANYTPYDGDESFLAGPTERSLHIKKIVEETKAHYEETRFPRTLVQLLSLIFLLDLSIKKTKLSLVSKMTNSSN